MEGRSQARSDRQSREGDHRRDRPGGGAAWPDRRHRPGRGTVWDPTPRQSPSPPPPRPPVSSWSSYSSQHPPPSHQQPPTPPSCREEQNTPFTAQLTAAVRTPVMNVTAMSFLHTEIWWPALTFPSLITDSVLSVSRDDRTTGRGDIKSQITQ